MRLALSLALSLAAVGAFAAQAVADEVDLLILAEEAEQVATDGSQEAYFLGEAAKAAGDAVAQQRFNTVYGRLNKIAFNFRGLQSDLDFFHSIPRARDSFRSRLGDLAEVERGMAMVRDPSPELVDLVAMVLQMATDFGSDVGVVVPREALVPAMRIGDAADALSRELYLDLTHFAQEARNAGDLALATKYNDAATAANRMQYNHWRWVGNLDFFKDASRVLAEVQGAGRDVTAFRTAMARLARHAPAHVVAQGDTVQRAAADFQAALSRISPRRGGLR